MKIIIIIDDVAPEAAQHTMKIVERKLGAHGYMYRGQDYHMGVLDNDCKPAAGRQP